MGWALLILAIVFNALLIYRMVTNHRQWQKEQAAHHRRIIGAYKTDGRV